MLVVRRTLAWWVPLVVGCGVCSSPQPERGATEYAACLNREVPEFEERTVGAIKWAVADGVLDIRGPEPLRLAAFAGPAPLSSSLAPALGEIAAGRPHVLLVLGELGEDATAAAARVRELAASRLPVLLLSGLRDQPAIVEDALEAASASNIVWLDGLRSVRIGQVEFIPVPGAHDGRYAFCGFGDGDVAQRIEALGDPGSNVRRFLVSTVAGEGPAAAGLAGLPAGDPGVASLYRRTRAAGGIYGFPHEQAGRVFARGDALELVVRPLAGPVLIATDGAPIRPGPTWMEISGARLSLPGPPS